MNKLRLLACSTTQKLIALADDRGGVQLQSWLSSESALLLEGHWQPVRSAAFSLDGTQLATVGEDGAVACWNVSDGELLSRWYLHRSPLLGVCFSADKRFLFVVDEEAQLRKLQCSDGTVLGKLPSVDVSDGVTLRCAHKNNLLLVLGQSAAVVSVSEFRVLCELSACTATLLENTENLFGFNTEDEQLLVDASSGEVLEQEPTEAPGAVPIASLPDGTRVLYSRYDSFVLWDVAGRSVMASVPLANPIVQSAVSPEGLHLATIDSKNEVRVWESETLRSSSVSLATQFRTAPETPANPLADWPYYSVPKEYDTFGSKASIVCVGVIDTSAYEMVCAPQRSVLQIYTQEKHSLELSAWDLWSCERQRTYRSGRNLFDDGSLLAIAPSGNAWLSGHENSSVVLWMEREHTLAPKKLFSTGQEAQAGAFSLDGLLIAAGDVKGSVRLYDVVGDKVIAQFDRHAGLRALRISRSKRWLCVAPVDSPTALYDLQNNQPAQLFAPYDQGFISFSCDEKLLGVSGTGTVLWSIEERRVLEPKKPLTGIVHFSPRRHWFLEQSLRSLTRWDQNTLEPIDRIELKDPDERFRCVTFEPDGERLFASTSKNKVLVYKVPSE